MSSYVKSVKATGVYGKFDLYQQFEPGVNILYGRNGTGKTTLLHILANALNADYFRFAFLQFEQITIELDDSKSIQITFQGKEDNAIIEVRVPGMPNVRTFKVLEGRALLTGTQVFARQQETLGAGRRSSPQLGTLKPALPTAYFPAFRTMIDAWVSREEVATARYRSTHLDPRYSEWDLYERQLGVPRSYPLDTPEHEDATSLARSLFGDFVPVITYRSPIEITQELNREIRRAEAQIAAKDRELLSTAFESIFSALSEKRAPRKKSDEILNRIGELLTSIAETALVEAQARGTLYSKLREQWAALEPQERSTTTRANILEVYRESLEELATLQKKATANLRLYLKSVNVFLEGKNLAVHGGRVGISRIGVTFADGSRTTLRALSSGEREIVTLLYASTHMNQDKVVLIDEPELSLHVDWQRALIRAMSDQLGERQIIVCTHSPIIGADYLQRRQELQWKAAGNSTMTDEDKITENVESEA